MKIFITGAGGYIGTQLCADLLAQGHQVIAYDRFFFGTEVFNDASSYKNFSFIKNDTRNLNEVHLLGVDVVIDLAALSNDPCGDLKKEWTAQINFEARKRTAAISKAAGVKKFILASSCSVYGKQGNLMVCEKSDCKPQSSYAFYNLKAEEACLRENSKDFQVIVLRLATVFGLSKRMRFDLIVNLMTLSAFEENVINVLGGGEQWRPLIHTQDLSRAFCECIMLENKALGGQIMNVGYDNFQVAEVATQIGRYLQNDVQIKFLPGDNDERSYRVDFGKSLNLLNFRPKRDIAFGATEVFTALKEHRVTATLKTKTVDWYKHLLASNQHFSDVALEGKLLDL
jgi:nucleoside-diphosphate-sugar epimerase